jgi:hypothetical protein
MQSGSYQVTARPATTTGTAPADRRQINSQDTQTAGSVVSKSQAAYRHPTLSQSGGFRYNPTTSVTLAISSGSVENLNVSTRHGCTR